MYFGQFRMMFVNVGVRLELLWVVPNHLDLTIRLGRGLLALRSPRESSGAHLSALLSESVKESRLPCSTDAACALQSPKRSTYLAQTFLSQNIVFHVENCAVEINDQCIFMYLNFQMLPHVFNKRATFVHILSNAIR